MRHKLAVALRHYRADKLDPQTNALRMKQSVRVRVAPDDLRDATLGGHVYRLEAPDQDPNLVDLWIREMREVHVPAGNTVEIFTRMDLTKIHRKRLYRLTPAGGIAQKPSNILEQYPALMEMDWVCFFNTFCLQFLSFVIGAFV